MFSDEIFNVDLAERRAFQHESECRGAATYLCNPASRHVVTTCKRGKCRRWQVCVGPMVACKHSVEPIFLLDKHGFRILDIPFVPACVANSELPLRRRFEALRERFRKALFEETSYGWPAVASRMKALGWNRAPGPGSRTGEL